MQGIGEVDWPLIFVPSVRIAKRFVDTWNSSVCHLTSKMQKGIHFIDCRLPWVKIIVNAQSGTQTKELFIFPFHQSLVDSNE
ncbi:hypothetical protein RGQ29_017629 [Quercus rubra]|uniref:Uncharacterized protein n=1 Tax=Quercus rubra TaxID=3512 RepID=A0AAN7FN38_QUERU|nr:hypothetical protein RGQ29_017629 [Quercus rubra]